MFQSDRLPSLHCARGFVVGCVKVAKTSGASAQASQSAIHTVQCNRQSIRDRRRTSKTACLTAPYNPCAMQARHFVNEGPRRLRTGVRRHGFTLLEIMIVIVIIATLSTLLVSAVSRAMHTARVAEVKVEISAFEKAIADFKATYGIEPPSRIDLYEIGTQWTDPTILNSTRSRAIIRRIWPDFIFALNRNLNRDPGGNFDIDPDGNGIAGLQLTGAECLVFFLGGAIYTDADGNIAPAGFSKNPGNPFLLAQTISETRTGPFHAFETGRLIDVDGDNIPEYVDTLTNQTAPYLYVSSNEGRGYDPRDLIVFNDPAKDMNEDLDGDGSVSAAEDLNNNGVIDASVYLQGTAANSAPYNPKTFQIISPGHGPHEFNAVNYKPYGRGFGVGGSLSEQDGDNITNFSQGELHAD